MDRTDNLDIPYIMAAQAQKHVTHNEAIRALDAIVQLSVLDRDLTTPPLTPTNGERYIIATSATGEWAGKDDQIAAYQDGAWMYYSPLEGWLVWIADEDRLLVWNGAAWVDFISEMQNPATLVGVNTTADTTNRLAVSSPNSLFTHEGSDHRVKINKASQTDTVSLLFQCNWSGRAEIGLAGDDDFHFKVSADGSSWHDALTLSAASGVARLKSFTVVGLPAAGAAETGAIVYISDESGGAVLAFCDGTNWRRVTDRAIVS